MEQTNISKIFSKEYQKELRSRYEEGLKEVWKNRKTGEPDMDMVNYCLKNTTYYIPICGGKYIVELSKPNIESEFWFGESDCGQGPSHEENQQNMNTARFMIEDYFMERNLSGIDDMLEKLNKIKSGKTELKLKHYVHYCSCPENSPCHGITIWHPWYGCSVSGETFDIDENDIDVIIEAYKLHREKFVKRLETYLKRFSDKLSVHSYWMDR